ncbi:MAG TPA: prepilin-type N-terminal cleavage/methylation domain-containing protein [Chthoniobacterales bacterium]
MSPRSDGFTLSELLVAIAILGGLISLLFSVVDQTTRIWRTSEQRVDAFREARAALFTIARDLESMVASPDSDSDGAPDFNFFFANPDRAGKADITFSGIAEDTEGDRLFFLTALPHASQGNTAKSDVCGVGYYLDYVSGPQNSFKLFRYFIGSDETFVRLKTYVSGDSNVLMEASSATDESLARNVIHFKVIAYDESMTAISPWPKDRSPIAIDLSITAYGHSVANGFLNRSDWLNVANPRNRESKQTFTTRIRLPQR